MEHDRSQAIGLFAALLAGVLFGTAVAVSRYAYDAGASGILVAGFRSIIVVVVLAAVVKVAGHSWSLPRSLILLVISNGILMAVMTYGNIGAVEFISVGLASLLFFTFPVIIAVLVIILRIERVSLAKLIAIGLAFAGIAAMLGASVGNVDWRGTAFSLVAALATAVNAIMIARYFTRVNILVATLHLSIVALITLVLIAAFVAEVRLPSTPGGWWGVIGVAVFQAAGTPLYMVALARIGALKAGMATNIQPVTAIFEAWVLFGEVLSVLQALGGAMVLIGIALMQWIDLRGRTPVSKKSI